MNPRLFFIHLPKTAGTTFNAFLDQQYPLADIAPPEVFEKGSEYLDKGDPEGRLRYLRQFSLYRGHYPYQVCKLFMPEYVSLTVLRDPVKRIVSQYNDWRSKSEESLAGAFESEKTLAALARDLPFRDFFQSDHPLVARFFHNGQARPLATNFRCKMEGQALKDLALANLKKIDYVGITEAFDLFLLMLCERFGWHYPQRLQSLNKARHSLQVEDLDDDTLAIIAEKNEADIALYNLAKELALDMANRIAKGPFPEKSYLDFRGQAAITITMADSIPGTGWHVLEGVGGDRLWRWTGPNRETTLFIGLSRKKYALSIRVISVIDDSILKESKILVNNTPIATNIHKDENEGFLIKGTIPKAVIGDRVPTQLTLVVPRTMAATDIDPTIPDPRQKGLAIQEILLRPVQERGWKQWVEK
ncbi:MAG: sulfotransferase family 2 domain-containing protein [Leptolyngbyaceae cyanobacterium]